MSLVSPALQAGSLPTEPSGKPYGTLLNHKKEQKFAISTMDDLKGIILNEISQTVKDKYYIILLISRI